MNVIPILAATIILLMPTNVFGNGLQDAQNGHVTSILSTEEQALKEKAPTFLQPKVAALPSPSALFQSYAKTGDSTYKEAAQIARTHLTAAAAGALPDDQANAHIDPNGDPHPIFTAIKDGISNSVDNIFHPLTYERVDLTESNPLFQDGVAKKYAEHIANASSTTGMEPDLLATVLKKENRTGDPKAVNQNRNGTTDVGLMQINSVNIPTLTKYFAEKGQKFDPYNADQSVEGAAVLLKSNKTQLEKALGRVPTPKEIYISYNLGVNGAVKAIEGDLGKAALAAKYTAGLFQ